jgi:FtsP/CotA-like multicopper oxidase with cupredoxin domain
MTGICEVFGWQGAGWRGAGWQVILSCSEVELSECSKSTTQHPFVIHNSQFSIISHLPAPAVSLQRFKPSGEPMNKKRAVALKKHRKQDVRRKAKRVAGVKKKKSA